MRRDKLHLRLTSQKCLTFIPTMNLVTIQCCQGLIASSYYALHGVVFKALLLQQSSISKGDRCGVKCSKDKAI